jgi:hypothetical protein
MALVAGIGISSTAGYAQSKVGTLLEASKLESETDLLRAQTAHATAKREFERQRGAGQIDLPRVIAIVGMGSDLLADVRYSDGRRRLVSVGEALASRVTVSAITPQEVLVLLPSDKQGTKSAKYMLEFQNPALMTAAPAGPGQILPMPLMAPPEPLPLPASPARAAPVRALVKSR